MCYTSVFVCDVCDILCVCVCGLRLKRALAYLKVHYRSQANPQ